VSYLLRLVLPDRPGVLGAVATALGETGADIVSLDVLERGNGVAVDDLVVDLPRDRLPDSLITAAQQVPDVQVESIRPFAGSLSTQRELELLEELVRAPEGTTGKLLAVELPRAFHSGWAVLLAGSAPDRCAVLAASDAAPSFEGVRLPWMPLTAPRLLPSEEDWLPERWRSMAIEMMAVPFGPAPEAPDGTVIVLGRSGGPAFRRSELLRLVHLAGIAATVASLPPV
jgi:hypothetical protein